ncbi:MAG: system TPR-repeat protein PrsT [Pseudomonadota bacterium]
MRSKSNFRPVSRVRPLRTALVAAIALALGAGCTGEDATVDHVANARKAIENREFRAAEIELKNALRKNPGDAEARLLLAEGHLRFGDGRAAETNLDKAEAAGMAAARLMVPRLNAWMLQQKFEPVVAIDPETLPEAEYPTAVRVEILAVQGDAHLALKDEERAKEKYAAALMLEPNNGPALVGEAQLAVRNKDNERGLELARQATRMAPAYAPGWSVLGDLLRQTGDLPAAEKAYTQAIKFRETNREDLLSRAMVRISRNDLDGALADAAILRKRGHAIPHATFISGIVNLAKARPEAAREDFEQVVANAPRYVVAACYLGQSHATTNNYEQAAAHLGKCHKYYGSNGAVRRLYAGVLAADGRESEAVAVLDPVVAANKGEAQDIELLAQVQLLQGDAEEAVSLLQRLLEANGGSSATYLNLGYALVAAGQVDESRAAFAEASKLGQTGEADAAEEAKYGLLEVRALLQSGNTSEAIQRLRAQLKADPANRPASNMLALALIRTGEQAEARTLLEKIVEEDPGYDIGRINLASLKAQAGEFAEARAMLLPVLQREPANPQLLGMVTALDVQLGESAQAVARLDPALSKTPGAPALMLLKARLLKSRGELEKATETYQDLVELPDPDPVWLRELIGLQMQAGRPVAAMAMAKRLSRMQGATAADQMMLREILQQTGDDAGSKRALADAVAGHADNLGVRMAQIQDLIGQRDARAARETLEKIRKELKGRELPDLLMLESQILVLEERMDEAVSAARKALKLEPTSKRAVELARLQAVAGRGTDAVIDLENWLAEHPDDFVALFVLGDALDKQGDEERARATYEKVLTLAPKHPWALNNLAWLLRDSDPVRARSLAEEAYSAAAKSPAVMDTLGMILSGQGDHARGLELLREANALAPGEDVLKLHLAQVLLATEAREEALALVQSLSGRPLSTQAAEEYARLKAALGL